MTTDKLALSIFRELKCCSQYYYKRSERKAARKLVAEGLAEENPRVKGEFRITQKGEKYPTPGLLP